MTNKDITFFQTQLKEMSNAKVGWPGDYVSPPTAEIIAYAQEALEMFGSLGILPVDVGASIEEGIGFTLEKENRFSYVEFLNQNSVVVAITDTDGKDARAWQLDLSQIGAIEMLCKRVANFISESPKKNDPMTLIKKSLENKIYAMRTHPIKGVTGDYPIPQDEVVVLAIKALESLYFLQIIPDRVAQSIEGGIGFTFLREKKYAYIEFSNDNTISALTEFDNSNPSVWDLSLCEEDTLYICKAVAEFVLDL